ncbi:MAG TPA: hypothetical protein VHK47_02760 [Polyangia bacterium]|jgi:hypothetical protein|nr:hypothetical protein [Polyangia bacterium]
MTKAEQPADTLAPATNFKLSVEERLNAYVQGVPGHIRRRRQIEDVEARLLAKLAEAEAPAAIVASAEIAAELARLNDLIARHNRYYPIEANLAIELRTGRLLERGAPWRPLPAITAADLLARAAAR